MCSPAPRPARPRATTPSRSCRPSRRARSTASRSSSRCRGVSRASCARFRPDAVLTQSPHEAAACLLGRRLAGSRDTDHRRAARRLAHRDPPLRLLGAARCSARSSTGWRLRRCGARTPSARSRRTRPASPARSASSPPRPSPPSWTSSRSSVSRRPLPEAAAGALRRRARALQERRRARRGLARRGGPPARGAAADRRRRVAARGRRGAVARAAAASWTGTSLRRRSPPRSTPRRCSCSRPGRRGWAACSSRRSAAAAEWSATRVGGIRDLVEDGESGLLVEPGSTRALADALVRVLSDASLAARLGEGAAAAAGAWIQTPEQYAERVRALVEA